MSMEKIIITIFIIGMIVGYASDIQTKRKIRKFNKRLTDFEKIFFKDLYKPKTFVKHNDAIEYAQLETMQNRLDKLRFCYQCPLYQDKVQEDRRENLQQDK